MTGHINGEYRFFRSRVSGYSESIDRRALKRVAISFNPEQIEKLNNLAQDRGCSFSKAVSDVVDMFIARSEDAA